MNVCDFELVETEKIPWIKESSERLLDWLIEVSRGCDWTDDSRREPGVYRFTVSWIVYETLFEGRWSEVWFQDGIRACVLRALEYERAIRLYRSRSGDLYVESSGKKWPIDSFLRGDSLELRREPDATTFSWGPIDTADHILNELGDYNFYWKEKQLGGMKKTENGPEESAE